MAKKSKQVAEPEVEESNTIDIIVPTKNVRQRTKGKTDDDGNPVYETDENGQIVINEKTGAPKQAREPLFYKNGDPMMEIFNMYMSNTERVQVPVINAEKINFKGIINSEGEMDAVPSDYKCTVDREAKALVSTGTEKEDGTYDWKTTTIKAEDAVKGIEQDRENYKKNAPKASFTVGVDNIMTNKTTGNRFANVYLDENTRVAINMPKDAEIPEKGSYTFEVPANYTANLQIKDEKTGHYDRTEEKISYADASDRAAEDWQKYQEAQQEKYAKQEEMRDQSKANEEKARQAVLDQMNERINENQKKAEKEKTDDSDQFN